MKNPAHWEQGLFDLKSDWWGYLSGELLQVVSDAAFITGRRVLLDDAQLRGLVDNGKRGRHFLFHTLDVLGCK